MIEPRLFNQRAYINASNYARKNHSTVYLIYRLGDSMVAVTGLDRITLEELPPYYTEHLYFWRRPKDLLVRTFGDKLRFVTVADFIGELNQKEFKS